MVSWNSFESLDLYHGLTICRSLEAYKRLLRVDYTQIIEIVQQSGTYTFILIPFLLLMTIVRKISAGRFRRQEDTP